MRKALFRLALLSLPFLLSTPLSSQEPKLLQHKATLTFTFIPKFVDLAKGEWRLVVVTPDNKTFKSKPISMPLAPYTQPKRFRVTHALYSGLYTVATENMSVSGLTAPSANLIDGLITIYNWKSKKTIDVNINDAATNDPGTLQVANFSLFQMGEK